MSRVVGTIHAVDDVWWYDAPLPRRWHRCRPWTTGTIEGDHLGPTPIHRCACGAMRFGETGPWIHRNERRRK